jgi:trk system potassium uptake protein TrkH
LLGAGFLLALANPFGLLSRATDLQTRADLVRAWAQAILLVWIALGFGGLYQWVSHRWENPALLFAGSFASLIALGTLLLMLPRARSDPDTPVPLSTALFTATSAVCVTGLVVEETSDYWSREGQWIILALFQMGGLGIATLSAYLVRALGGRPSLRETVLQGRLLEHEVPGEIHKLLRTIILVTVAAEVLGAFLLSGLWAELSGSDQVFFGIFHSVSAFCNAGFSVQRHGLERMGHHWQVRWVVPGLIIVGGLGFGVLRNLGQDFTARVHGWWAQLRGVPAPLPGRGRWHLTTRLVLVTTLVLLAVGTVGIFLLELGNPKVNREGWAHHLDVAWFQAVTCRTAGFNTVPLKELGDPTKFFMIVLMFIGASPGSTGGGVKTVSVAVLTLVLWSAWRRRTDVEVAHRHIPLRMTRQALLILTVASTILVVLTLALTTVEALTNPEIQLVANKPTFLDYLFETASALGTVGLSTGVTPTLTPAGQFVLIVGMFVGRVGPFTLILAAAGREERLRYAYPQEGVVLG